MKRCSFCEWIPILPWPVCPLAGQCVLGQNTVVGSMTILLAMRGNIATRSMSGPLFALQLHRTTVWCGATTQLERLHFPSKRTAYRRLQALTEPAALQGDVVTWPGRCRERSGGWRAAAP